jgi:hypothetical protein
MEFKEGVEAVEELVTGIRFDSVNLILSVFASMLLIRLLI